MLAKRLPVRPVLDICGEDAGSVSFVPPCGFVWLVNRILQLVLGWFDCGLMVLSLSRNVGQHIWMRRSDIKPLSRVVPQVV